LLHRRADGDCGKSLREWDSEGRDRGGWIVRHIMVCTDGSEGSLRAVDAAARLAKAMDSELFILTVGGSLSGEELRRLARAEKDLGAALDAISDGILKQAKERARQSGISAIKTRAAWGDPAEVIIETARAEQMEAIVIGRRGRGRLAGLLLGSVSQKVASLASCNVIVVP
jgi:nucleotide-binding universal stress UspA family protein